MPFSPIVVNTKTFNQAGDGRYMRSTVSFGQPSDLLIVKGGTLNKDKQNITTAVTRALEKDVTVGTVTSRRVMTVQLVITAPTGGFTTSEIDACASDISEFLTTATLDRLLAGES